MECTLSIRPARAVAVVLIVLTSSGCAICSRPPSSPVSPAADEAVASPERSDCRFLFDAGSSGSRLYLYEHTDAGWVEHRGNGDLPALADPVREIRGMTWDDIDRVVAEIVGALPAMVEDGPLDDGEPAWTGFDWRTHCNVLSAGIYATAGMRIAEQTHRARAAELWPLLERGLAATLGDGVAVSARTLSGFEEGLFTWLALRETAGSNDFGIAEMGGASTQVAYPCPQCAEDAEDVRTVIVDGEPLRLFSYSFLGLGVDEASKSLGFPMSCRYGIGELNPGWQEEHCASRIDFSGASGGIYDPYNFGDGRYGIDTDLPTADATVSKWYLNDVFSYMSADDLDRCCRTSGECYQAETACFRAVYLRKYLAALGLEDGTPTRERWTKGANLCLAEDCLSAAKPAPICRWAEEGCLGE